MKNLVNNIVPYDNFRYISDACVAVTIAVILFAFPSHRPNILFFRKKGGQSDIIIIQ